MSEHETLTAASVHVDTADRRLARAGLDLRGGAITTGSRGWLWILRLPAQVDKATFKEREVVWSAGSSDVPDEAASLLRVVTADGPLLPVAVGQPVPAGPHRAPLDRSSTLDDVLTASVAGARSELVAQDLGLRIDDHPEFVHQARVATRTLRSDLRTFRPLLDPTWVADLRDELKWLADALGEVRDLDVLRARLDRRRQQLPAPADGLDPAGPGLAAIMGRLDRAQHEARAALAEVLRSSRYHHLLTSLEEPVRWADDADPCTPAHREAGRLVRRPWRRLARQVAALGQDPPDAELHDVRLRAKQVRYASEALAPVVGPSAARLGQRARALQGVLGDHQDAVEAERWLRSATSGGAEEAWFGGQAALLEAEDRRAARDAWVGAWQALDRRSLRRWLR